MKIKFWGTRGSIPTPITTEVLQKKIRQALQGAVGLDLGNPDVLDRYMERLSPVVGRVVGGNTPCIEVQSGDQLLILDAGSGLRLLGGNMLKRGFGAKKSHADFLMTHTHWDHVQGFPFFTPAFLPHNSFTFYSPITDLEERFRIQQDPRWFPVNIDYMQAKMDFVVIDPVKPFQLGNFTITPLEMWHPGRSYGYRIVDGDSCLVYATDSAYQRLDIESNQKYVDFFQNADLLIFDTHFGFVEANLDKPDWGHSTAMVGAEFSYRANVKRLALFHHNPLDQDEKIYLSMQQAQAYLSHRTLKYPCEVLIAEDGLTLEI